MNGTFVISNENLTRVETARLRQQLIAMRDELVNRSGDLDRIRKKQVDSAIRKLDKGGYRLLLDAEALLTALDAEGIEAASGSACTTALRKTSHVLEAIGVDPVTARGALTFSFGETNRDSDSGRVAVALGQTVSRLRALSPLSQEP